MTVNWSPKSVLPFHTVLESSLFTWTCGTTEDASVPPDLIIPLLVLCTTCSWGTFTPKSQHLFLFGRGLPLDCESPRCLCPRVLKHNSHAHRGASLRWNYTAFGPVCRIEALFPLTSLLDLLFLSHFPTPLHLFHSFLRAFFFFPESTF